MTVGQRFLLTIAIVLAMLFALAFCGYQSGTWTEAKEKEVDLYQGVPMDRKLLELDKRALDEAYHQHVIRLWNVWLTDGAKEAHRISNGLRISRQAYVQAAEQIAKREASQP